MTVADLLKMLADYPADAPITSFKVVIKPPERRSTISLVKKGRLALPSPLNGSR